ncbi:MAG: hypothetical protein JWP75_506 [Frondihabitans sp.]|nr:hypothetical protein [Frondihabitans sp.]
MFGIALFLHLLGVVLLVGAVSTTLVVTLRVQTARTIPELRTVTAATKRIESVLVPAMIIIIVTGVYMLAQHSTHGDNPWIAGWVITAEVVTVLLGVIGRTVEARDAKRLHTAIENASNDRPNAELRKVQLASSPIYSVFFGTSQVIAVLFLMTNRPGLAVSIAACLIAALASVIVAAVRLRTVRRTHPLTPAGLGA